MSVNKNDQAWEKLFERYNVLEQIALYGYFEITSFQINTERESRLMAKFDHRVNLPRIFQKNNLSILPISRNKYIIGKFEAYCNVNYDEETELISYPFPDHIESIDYTNLFSESAAINCAFNTGLINNIVNEEMSYTVSGRMSTNSFNFTINHQELHQRHYYIKVENSQCEIDGGFESENYFLIIEAKNYRVNDFLIRQLYYPYRLWKTKIKTKKVIPILMTYSNDIFSFFVYEFRNDNDYNSICLVEQQDYAIAPEEIERIDIDTVFYSINTFLTEPSELEKRDPGYIPFPQADVFTRVVDLLSLLAERDLTIEEVTQNYEFDVRQARYYTAACRYLGLVENYKNPATCKVAFRLTNEGRKTVRKKHKAKYLTLIRKILEHEVFYKVFEAAMDEGEIPSKNKTCQIMSESLLKVSPSTLDRRADTVRAWVNWIVSQAD